MRLLGSDVKIVGSDTLHDVDDAFGMYDARTSTIKLDTKAEQTQQGEHLVHEVVEMAKQKLELRLSHAAVTGIATALHQWLRDNPALARDIIAGRRLLRVKE